MFSPGGKKKIMLENLRAVGDVTTLPMISPDSSSKSKPAKSSGPVSPVQVNQKVFKKSTATPLTKEKIEQYLAKDDHISLAVQKLALTVSKFNPLRDGILLNAFRTCSLTFPEFRMMVKRVLFLEFSDDEFEHICRLLDANGDLCIDGEEFLVSFTLLATSWRDRVTKRFREEDRTYLLEQKDREQREKAQKEEAIEQAADFSFSKTDQESAVGKLREASKKYMKNHPSAIGLEGFDVKFVKPGEFRELLKRTFNVQVDRKELGALIRYFNGDANSNLLECGSFLIQFARMGHDQRDEMRLKQLEASRRAEQALIKHHEQVLEELASKMEIGVDRTYSEEDKKRAFEALNVAAVKFQKHHPSSMSLDGFEAKYLTPGAFKEMLKRTFNLVMSNKELGALIDFFDEDKQDKVLCKSFMLYFSKVGFAGKSKRFSDDLQRQRREIARQEEEHEIKMAKQWEKMALSRETLDAFTPADLQSALQKIGTAAIRVNGNSAMGSVLAGFQGRSLIPAVFRELCRRTLNIRFTNEELASLLAEFDLDGNRQEISCIKFMARFQSLAFEYRESMRAVQLEKKFIALKEIEDHKAHIREIEEKGNASVLLMVDWNFSESDHKSAMEKVVTSAQKFDKSHPSCPSLDPLEVSLMNPGLFRSILGKTLRINLTAKEAGALCSQYMTPNSDKKTAYARTGEVRVQDFMQFYFETNLNYREYVRQRNLKKKNDLEQARVDYVKQKEAAILKAHDDRLRHDKDDESTLMGKVKKAARMFAVDNASYMATLQSFKGPALTAEAFQTTFFRIFLIKLSLPEIGVLMHVLNPTLAKSHFIEGEKFLKSFFKLSRLEEQCLLGLLDESTIGLEAMELDTLSVNSPINIRASVNGFNPLRASLDMSVASASSGIFGERTHINDAALDDDGSTFTQTLTSSDNASSNGQERKGRSGSMMLSVLSGSNPWTEWGLRESGYLGSLDAAGVAGGSHHHSPDSLNHGNHGNHDSYHGKKKSFGSVGSHKSFGLQVGKVRQIPISEEEEAMTFWESMALAQKKKKSVPVESPDFSTFKFHGGEQITTEALRSRANTALSWASSSDDGSLGEASAITSFTRGGTSSNSSKSRQSTSHARSALKTPQKLLRSSLPRTFSAVGLLRQASSPPKK